MPPIFGSWWHIGKLRTPIDINALRFKRYDHIEIDSSAYYTPLGGGIGTTFWIRTSHRIAGYIYQPQRVDDWLTLQTARKIITRLTIPQHLQDEINPILRELVRITLPADELQAEDSYLIIQGNTWRAGLAELEELQDTTTYEVRDYMPVPLTEQTTLSDTITYTTARLVTRSSTEKITVHDELTGPGGAEGTGYSIYYHEERTFIDYLGLGEGSYGSMPVDNWLLEWRRIPDTQQLTDEVSYTWQYSNLIPQEMPSPTTTAIYVVGLLQSTPTPEQESTPTTTAIYVVSKLTGQTLPEQELSPQTVTAEYMLSKTTESPLIEQELSPQTVTGEYVLSKTTESPLIEQELTPSTITGEYVTTVTETAYATSTMTSPYSIGTYSVNLNG